MVILLLFPHNPLRLMRPRWSWFCLRAHACSTIATAMVSVAGTRRQNPSGAIFASLGEICGLKHEVAVQHYGYAASTSAPENDKCQDRRFANYIRVVCPDGASRAVQIRSRRICAQPQAARRVASMDGRNEGNEKSYFFISISAYVPRRAFSEVLITGTAYTSPTILPVSLLIDKIISVVFT